MTALAARTAPPRHRLEPAELLYGRLLASAAAGGEPGEARVRIADGRAQKLPLRAGSRPVDAADRAVLAHAVAPVLDIGCGPGRHLAALAAAGHDGLGLDLSPVAVRLARARGAEAILRSVFADVPRAGTWRPRCCSTATSASAARPPRCSPAPARSSRRAARAGRDRAAGGADAARARAARDARGDQPVVRLGDGRRGRDRAARARRRARAARAGRGRRALVRAAGAPAVTPPPGPFRPGFWRSPLRGPWLTAVLGSLLLVLVAHRRADRLPLPRRLPARPRAQRARRPRPAVHDVLRLADRAVVALRAHAGPARQRRAGRGPGAAREAVVGDPAAVRVAAGAHARRGRSSAPRSPCSSRARSSCSRPASRTSSTGTSSASTSSRRTTTPRSCSSRRSPCTSSSRSRSRCARTARAACSRRCATSSPRRARSPTATSSRSRPTRRRSAAAGCSPRSAAARCAARRERRPVDRRPAAQHRVPRAAARGRLPGQQDRRRREGHRRRWSAPATGSCCAAGRRRWS